MYERYGYLDDLYRRGIEITEELFERMAPFVAFERGAPLVPMPLLDVGAGWEAAASAPEFRGWLFRAGFYKGWLAVNTTELIGRIEALQAQIRRNVGEA